MKSPNGRQWPRDDEMKCMLGLKALGLASARLIVASLIYDGLTGGDEAMALQASKMINRPSI